MGVCVARQVQPVARHVLCVVRRSQQAVNDPLEGASRVVSDEGGELLRLWREPGQVEGYAPEPGRAVCLRRGLQPRALQAALDEGVDPVTRPRGVAHWGQRRPRGGDEGPVPLVASALFDPADQERSLLFAELCLGLRRRHAVLGELFGDALNEEAGCGIARHDRGASASLSGRPLALIEAQPSLALRLIRSVAVEARSRQDRLDVSAVLKLFTRVSRRREGARAQEQRGCEHRGVSSRAHMRGTVGSSLWIRRRSLRASRCCPRTCRSRSLGPAAC